MGENNRATTPSDSGTGASGSQTSPSGTAPNSAPQYTAEYLAQLLKDKKQLSAFPSVFLHLERLVDEEIGKVRLSLFQFEFNKDGLALPEPVGPVQTLQEKVYVPVKEYPDYNFVGRILGPRGMTAKQLEQETGCKIMVRGRGSMRDRKKEEQNRGKPNWEHLSDELHVLVQCEDAENRAKVKLYRAVEEIKKLLVPAPEGEDELKRKQLMELAIINGTYRPANQGKTSLQTPRLLTPMTLPSPLRSPTLGAPIILSPNRLTTSLAATLPNGLMTTLTSPLFTASHSDLSATGGLLFNPFGCSPTMDPSLAASYPYAAAAASYPYAAAAAALTSPLLAGEYPTLEMSQAGAILNQRRLLGQARDHPYQRGTLKTPTS